MAVRRLQAGKLKLEIHPDSQAAGQAAAHAIAECLRQLENDSGNIGVVFATGASQLKMLESLTSLPGLPWSSISGFHLDEYEGISSNHPASFRRYLRERLTDLVPIGKFHEIDGNTTNAAQMCAKYAASLQAAQPQICLLGIGENGHIAFNDPPEADFEDPLAMKGVNLDIACQEQQLAEGWFSSLQEVPRRAFTLTIPTIFHIPRLFLSVPGHRKAEAIRRTIMEPVSTSCPSTILRSHPDATVYLDEESAQGLSEDSFGAEVQEIN
jgi:glucosamine-6-phosphate deaminase